MPTGAPASSTMPAWIPGSGKVALPGLSVVAPGNALIMMAPVAADGLVVPDPRLGIDGFADRAQQPERRQIVTFRELVAPLHERPDRRGRGVEDRHLVLLDYRPESITAGKVAR